MPRSCPKPCSAPGCGRLTRTKFCEQHADRARTEPRRSNVERGYDAAWNRFSKRFRQANPLCAHCLEQGRTTPSQMVDHIVPLHVAPEKRLDESGCQALCNACHAVKTRDDVARYGAAPVHRSRSVGDDDIPVLG